MKKFYVKPAATNVAFVVNENIATSRGFHEELTGMGSFNNAGDNCNEVFNSTQIPTGLAPGEDNILKAMQYVAQLEDGRFLQEIMDRMDPLTGDFNCY